MGRLDLPLPGCGCTQPVVAVHVVISATYLGLGKVFQGAGALCPHEIDTEYENAHRVAHCVGKHRFA